MLKTIKEMKPIYFYLRFPKNIALTLSGPNQKYLQERIFDMTRTVPYREQFLK